MVDSTIHKYINYKMYSFIANTFDKLIYFRKERTEIENFRLFGVSLPSISLWRTKAPKIREGFYGQSVQKRDVFVDNTVFTGNLIDFTVGYTLYAASYSLDWIDKVIDFMNTVNIDRFYTWDMSDSVEGFTSRVEITVSDPEESGDVEEENVQRKLWIEYPFSLNVSVLYLSDVYYLERINLLLKEVSSNKSFQF